MSSTTTLSPETHTALIDRLVAHIEAECRTIDTEEAFDSGAADCRGGCCRRSLVLAPSRPYEPSRAARP